LENLQAGLRLSGLLPQPVSILAVAAHGPDAVTVTFQMSAAHWASGCSTAPMRPRCRLSPRPPDGSSMRTQSEFRLAAEALRIRMAGLHDPMVAVSSSAIDPLPHHIHAVYGELLPRTPLRFLLADDPGAGKTIMAGLYAKDFYARDFGRITGEVIQHLAAVDGVDLEVRLEITAVANSGFDEAKVRTVSENAHTLRFEQSGFEAE
jgi:hypothetical protein